jgi:hypothetical protein
MTEVVKIIVSMLFGGAAGALIGEWFRRRRERVQRVQLIERVNRPVSTLEGFTLVRVIDGDYGSLNEVKDLREYQLTMRNLTSTHLQNAEVQFEFPSDDVQSLVSLPALSRIDLVPIDTPKTAGKKVFRWTMRHFPAGDSVEFTFRAVAPSSDKYGYSLNHVGVILERIVGEPPPSEKGSAWQTFILILIAVATMAFALSTEVSEWRDSKGYINLAKISAAGCELQVVSSDEPYGVYSGIWQIKDRIINNGSQECVIQSHALNLDVPSVSKPGETLDRWRLSEHMPKLTKAAVSVGATGATRESTEIQIYAEP